MTITIVDHELPDYTHNLYDVTLFDNQIQTLLTHCPTIVDSWISQIQHSHRHRLHQLIVGLDVEWRPNFGRHMDNPIATLQLCVGRRCLIVQLIYSPSIPQSLISFLGNASYSFVGVGIASDVEKLLEDYGVRVVNVVDLRQLAVEVLGARELKNAGLKTLCTEVLGMEVSKPRSVTLSRWDNQWLTPAQVKYACVDAFLSFEIGRRLNASEAEKRRREEALQKAKLDEIAEKQGQREQELEEKEKPRKEAPLGRMTDTLSRPSEPPAAAHPLKPESVVPTAAASAAPSPGRVVPRFNRERAKSSGQAPPQQSAAASAAPSPGRKYVAKFKQERAESSGQAPSQQPDRWAVY